MPSSLHDVPDDEAPPQPYIGVMNAPYKSDLDRLQAAFDVQRSAFSFDTVPGISARRMKLRDLVRAIRARRSEIVAAVSADFGNRSADETLSAEIAVTIDSIKHTCRHLDRWANPTRVFNLGIPIPGRTYVRHEPKGVVGVISPWNYPFQLAVIPAATALAGGNKVLIKPSEFTPRMAELLARLFADVYGEDEVAVVTGGPDVGKAFSELPFDHLFFTGSTAVGRKVAMAAANNLTPITLELGGKSPCVMMPDADPEKHAPLVAFGKFYSGGQTCVAPDYLLVPKGRAEAFAEAIIAAARRAHPAPAADDGYTSIITEQHHDRLAAMIAEARDAGLTVLTAGDGAPETRRIPPTVVIGPALDSRLMSEEIFGPILPILEYDDLDHAVRFITARDHPLALYAFGRDARAAENLVARTTSGGAVVNGTIIHLAVEHLPFGGVGKSGYGAYHGKRGFAEFTHARSVLVLPQWPILRDTIVRPGGRRMRWLTDWMIGK